MIVPVPHDPRPGAANHVVLPRRACLFWAGVAADHMRVANDARKKAIHAGDDGAQWIAERDLLDARSVWMEFQL